MNTKIVRRFFPERRASLLHQNGSTLTVPTTGVEIILHTRENEKHPCCAELISGEHYVEIGLSFEGRKLVDYDGVFFLPREVGELLSELGYIIPAECFR